MPPSPGHEPDRGLFGRALALHAIDHPEEDAQVLAEAGPEEPAVRAGAEPVHVEDGGRTGELAAHVEPVLEVVGHVVAAERQHGHGIAAHDADLAGGGGGRLRAHGGARRRRRGPSRGLWKTSGATRARRPPKMIAESGTPCGSSQRGDMVGHWRAEAVKREFGCAALPVRSQGRPCQSMRRAGGVLSLPSHQGTPSGVTATFVKIVSWEMVAMAVGFVSGPVPGTTPKKPASGLTAHSRPSAPGPQPGDVVADRPHLVAEVLEGRDEHRQVRLAAGGGERGRDVVPLLPGSLELEDEHVLGHPALVARHGAGDAQREALLAEERVAAVAGADAPDEPLLREVHDEAALRATGRRANGGRARSRRRPPSWSSAACAHARHDPHVGDDVRAVRDLDPDLAERRAERPHHVGHDVHRPALHGALRTAGRPSPAPGRAPSSCWWGRRPPCGGWR